MQGLNVPMKVNYLAQAGSVQALLDSVVGLLGQIEDYSVKNELLCTLSAFYHERAAATVSMVDVLMKASNDGIVLSNEEAGQVMQHVIDELALILPELVDKHIRLAVTRPALVSAEASE